MVWIIVEKVMDWEVMKYKKKLAKEGRTVRGGDTKGSLICL